MEEPNYIDEYTSPGDHFVQFYDSESHLIESIYRYLLPALESGDAALMIATPKVREGVAKLLHDGGFNRLPVDQFITLDAAETLSQFMVNGIPDPSLFFEVFGSVVTRVLASGRQLFAFGEMVALLWSDGNHEAAVKLEELWNQLGKSQTFSLYCAYPVASFDKKNHAIPFQQICKCHSQVIPAESYSTLQTEHERMEAISVLQQKAKVLEGEIEKRKQAEQKLEQQVENLTHVRASLLSSESKLKEMDQKKDEFLAMLAHELRNPLSAISNGVALLERPTILEKDKPWIHEVLKRQISQLTNLLDDLLDVSRITSGKIVLKKERLFLADIVENAVQAIRPLFEKQDHRLSVSSLGCIPCWLYADASRLEQILVNLLSNASKYTPTNGRIALNFESNGKEILVSVKDTGIGIAGEMLPKVFDLFCQDKRSLDRSQGGLGIGLSVVKKLVELHEGSVTVTSSGIGQGSEFTLKFPAVEQPKVVELKSHIDYQQGIQSKKILIVDDNKDTAIALSILLQSEGHTTEVAHHGTDALKIAEGFAPDVALLDIGLPDIDGYELAEKLKTSGGLSEINLIAISGYGQPEDRILSKKAGFHHHFVKPVDIKTLLSLMNDNQKKSTPIPLKIVSS